MKRFNKLIQWRLLLVCIIFIITACSSNENSATAPSTSELLEFTIDGVPYEANLQSSGSSIRTFNAGGFTNVNVTGLFTSGINTFTFRVGFEGDHTGSYTLSGMAEGANEGLDITIRQGLSNTTLHEAESITLKVTTYQTSNGISMEATFSGTLTNKNTLESLNLTNGKIVILS